MLLCIGGVCVPYTAVVPILILGFKWLVGKLAAMGILPKAVQELLQVYAPPTPTEGEKDEKSTACCASSSSSALSSGPSLVKTLESDQDFQSFVKESEKVICKFTATWCKPCHKIQPFYEQCSSQYAEQNVTFLTIDVDDYDDIATTYNVAMMPTFVILKGGNESSSSSSSASVLGKYAGSNEHELQRFLKEHLE